VLVAVALLAAACSSPTAVGQVGATLAAMNGTVTLAKVIFPAPVVAGSAGPAYGRQLAAAVLTVHSPATAATKFSGIYKASKLIDNHKLAHLGLSTAKYDVADCSTYPPFTTVAAGQTATGCVVFELSSVAIPVELKISGKSKADWTIAASAVQAGTAGAAPAPGTAPATTAPVTTPTTTPGAQALGATTTTVAPTTTVPGATTPARATTTTAAAGASTKPAGASASSGRPHSSTLTPEITRFTPRGARVGTKVQILGKRLKGVTSVTFNGVPAVIAKRAAKRIVAIVPEGATEGPIVVTSASGSATSPKTFVVL